MRELLSRLTSSEVTEWLAFYSLDPWGGERRFDLPAGIVAATIANANRGKNSNAFTPQDFMPDFGAPKKGSVEEQQVLLAKVKASILESHNK